MSLLQSLRHYFRNRSMQKTLSLKPQISKKKVNIQNAQQIGILFDATKLEPRQEALRYAKALKEQGKKVKVLGFINGHQKDAHFPFKYFDKKSIDWTQRPKGENVKAFLDQDFDIFVFLNPITSVYSEYIAALTNAHLKVGPIADLTDVYDLMINVKNKSSLPAFIKQMESILLKTNVEHEAA